MTGWDVVVLMARPSASISEFFNSITFHKDYIEAESEDAALLSYDERFLTKIDTGGLVIINWYAFEDKRGSHDEG